MKTIALAFAALSTFAALAAAEPRALKEAAMMADGTPARVVMDGGTTGSMVVAQAAATPAGAAERPPMRPSAVLSPRAATPAPAAKAKDEPGFFSKTWDKVKSPSVYVPALAAVSLGAMGFMVAGPLGALTGAVIGGLFGFIFAKAMGG